MAHATITITPSHLIISLLLISIPLLLVLLFKQCRNRKNGNLPPGPKKLPIIGNLHQLGPLPHHSLHDLSTKHGPLMSLQLGSIPTLVISSADAAGEIFKAHDIAFSGRPALYAARKLSYGLLDMTFAPYGEYWRQLRKICAVELLSVKRVQSFRAVREEEVASVISFIKDSSSSSSLDPINLSEMMLSLTSTITCRAAFGTSYRGGNHDEDGNGFHRILAETQRLLGGFCIGDFFPWLEWIHVVTGMRARLEKNFKELDGFYDKVIEEHLNNVWPKPDHENLVHVLLRLQKDRITFSSMNHIKGMLTDIFIAGTDTSSATLVWAMTELMRNPRVMSKLQQEVRDIVGNKGKVEECDLRRLDYLKLVVKEVLRLHPPAPLLVPRQTTEMCRIKEYEIPAKTRVFVNAKAITMDPKYWKNPEEFWPERFLGNGIEFRGQDFEWVPFGIGRRSCPGVSLAMVVVELTLANLLYCFDWGLPFGLEPNDLDLEEVFGLTVHKKNPLCLVVKPK